MRRSSGYVFAVLVGILAVLAPTGLAVYAAWHQGIADEQQRVLSFAKDVMRRAEEERADRTRDIERLQQADLPPCSPQEIALMQRLALASKYIVLVGRLQGNELVCSSLGKQVPPIALGPPDAITAEGVALRMNRLFSQQPQARLDFISNGDFGVVSNERLIFDTPTGGEDIRIASITPSAHRVISTTYTGITLNMIRPLPPGASEAYVRGGLVIAAVRAQEFDYEVAVTAPYRYVRQRVLHFALLEAPLALLGAGLLVWAVLRISRLYLSLPAVLRTAARRHEFFLEYQPIVDLRTGRWIGSEALVRWRRGSQNIPPDQFIPVAEASGVITHITREVMRMVCIDLPKLLEIDPEFRVAINLAAADLLTSSTLDGIDEILRQPGVKPANVKVEATEREFVRAEDTAQVLAKIRARGVGIAIDDFGIGYSSLAYLQTMPVDVLKIDKAFVDTIGTDGVTSEVTEQIIQIAHKLELGLIAEGVETEAQAEFLLGRGVYRAQGWLFSRPLRMDRLCAELKARRRTEQSGPEQLATIS